MAFILRFLLIAFLIYFLVKTFKKLIYKSNIENTNSAKHKSFNSYEVLNVDTKASKEEIHKAYKISMAEYHPDKVEHLGKDIQALAREKTRLIQEAYNQLNK